VQFFFADHRLDTDRRELHRGSELVAVEPQVFDLLVYLVQNRDRVVSKDDLIASVWGGRIVSDSTLTSRINAARKAVQDSGQEQRLIRTVARRGLRFVGAVEETAPATEPLASDMGQPPAALTGPLPLPAKPSIAVLPFTSMSNIPEDESFADGLTEDLITDLSRNAGLFVIARNSAFAYKGKSVDVRRISRDLGVRYLLEGSARRAAGRVRINAQLIDAVGGNHLWAERFDRTVEDVFDVQDEVTARIVEALIGRLALQAPRKRPANLEAYDLCVRARILTEETPQTAREAYLLLKRSIEIEPAYAEAHGLLGYNRWLAWTHFGEPEDSNRSLALDLAERAVALDPSDAFCRYVLGTVLAYDRRWQESDAEFTKALELDPNHADTWAALSDMSTLSGRVADGLEQIKKAFRLNPYPPVWYFDHLGQAQYAARDYESAIATLRREETYRTNSRRFLAASLAQLGRINEARREVEMFLVTHPHFTIRHWVASQPLRDAATADHFVEGFRKAGLPE
jgi:TolB-like protein/Flp pilus assembly protein TadD